MLWLPSNNIKDARFFGPPDLDFSSGKCRMRFCCLSSFQIQSWKRTAMFQFKDRKETHCSATSNSSIAFLRFSCIRDQQSTVSHSFCVQTSNFIAQPLTENKQVALKTDTYTLCYRTCTIEKGSMRLSECIEFPFVSLH